MATRTQIAAGLAVVLGVAVPAAAGIYHWTDAQGREHFTQDLGQVPASQRAAAKAAAEAPHGPSGLQTYDSPAENLEARQADAPAPDSPRRIYRIRVQRAGNSLVVGVRLDNRVVVPFIIDTGASYVVLPKKVADDLDLTPGPDARTLQFSTANGIVESPMVTIPSVELGGARAEGVPAAISDSVSMGLLGLSFWNRFTYQIDPASGTVTLMDNGLASSGALPGGRSEAQWRGEYRNIRARIAQVQARRARTPDASMRLLRKLDRQEARLRRQLDQLDAEADQAHVPQSWRR